jgi:hypothetical protein
MTLGAGMLALLNSNLMQYAEPIGRLAAMIDTGNAWFALTPGKEGGVDCGLYFERDGSEVGTSGLTSLDAIKSALDVARVRGLL